MTLHAHKLCLMEKVALLFRVRVQVDPLNFWPEFRPKFLTYFEHTVRDDNG